MKWRDKLRKQHLLPISYRGGGIESGRGKMERAVGKEQERKSSDREQRKWDDNSNKGENSWGRAMRGRTCSEGWVKQRESEEGRGEAEWRWEKERRRDRSAGRATERDWLVLYEIRHIHLEPSTASSSIYVQVNSTLCVRSIHSWREMPTYACTISTHDE